MASAAVRVAANLELAKSEKTDEELLAELMAEGQQGVEPPWYLDKTTLRATPAE